ncbi:hypothetical protein BV898_03007 [Hypsibius exemplaris]|uniref:G-protein coupled receptors family 1 profile domain-containing protein n=1 Tax=Hypsibius exemplaris TaxID=2072580 RepID=A0A1W0X654_HYPEX|nr:hypothetical protein BV898_03007 [Hypsibius exemplaris]
MASSPINDSFSLKNLTWPVGSNASNSSLPKNHIDVVYPNSSVIFHFLWSGYERGLYWWMIVNGLICFLGTAVNLAILVAMVQLERVTHSSCRIQIVHLLVIDLIQCAVSGPLGLTLNGQPRVLTLTECAFTRVPFMWVECSANWCASFLALNRFIAIWFPLTYRRLSRHRSFDIVSVVLPWFMGFPLVLPYIAGFGGRFTMSPPMYRCVLKATSNLPFEYTIYFGFITPMALLMVFYVGAGVKMALQLGITARRVGPLPVPDYEISRAREEKRFALARMLFVAAVLYIALYLPNPIVVTYFPRLGDGSPIYRMWLRTIYNAGFLVNPIVFLTMRPEYRKELRKQIRRLYTWLSHLVWNPEHLAP